MSSKIASMVLPGFAYSSDWTTAWALTQPAAIAALGFNWITLQTTYTPSTITDNNPSTSSAVPLSGITAMTSAAKTAGLKVCLKPHLVPADGSGQLAYLPGAQTTLVSGVGTGHYTSGAPGVTSTALNLTSANVGDRIVTPETGHTNEIPNSGLSNYGHTTPTWTTISSVTNSTTAVMSANATASSGNAFLYVLHDADTAVFFTNWTTILMNLLAAAASGGGADAINISTENDFLTCYYESMWRTLITTIRASYPNIKIYVDSALIMSQGSSFSIINDCTRVPFLDALDYIAFSCYPTVDNLTGGASVNSMRTNWENALNGLAAYSASWGNKPILFGEMGAMSVVGAGYEPYNSGKAGAQINTVTVTSGSPSLTVSTGGFPNVSVGEWVCVGVAASGAPIIPSGTTVQSVSGNTVTMSQNATGSGVAQLIFSSSQPSGVDQATFITSGLSAVWDQPWFAGFNWWNWYYTNNNVTNENTGPDFAPKPLAQTAFSDFLSRTNGLRIAIGSANYYRH